MSSPPRSPTSTTHRITDTAHQPFSWQAGLLFLGAGAALTVYFRYEKERMGRKRVAEHSKGMGRPLVGGPFSLVDHNGKPFTEQDLKGKYSLVYFGFTHCPDICPEELDKMAGMIDNVKEKHGNVMLPVFITCDPARDTPEVMKSYLQEFHADMLGLTGEHEQVKNTCKAYRVYFSTPVDVKPGQDYLVDHSIYFYLMGESGTAIVLGYLELTREQILRVTLLRLLVAILLLTRRRRLSMTMSLTGEARSTKHRCGQICFQQAMLSTVQHKTEKVQRHLEGYLEAKEEMFSKAVSTLNQTQRRHKIQRETLDKPRIRGQAIYGL